MPRLKKTRWNKSVLKKKKRGNRSNGKFEVNKGWLRCWRLAPHPHTLWSSTTRLDQLSNLYSHKQFFAHTRIQLYKTDNQDLQNPHWIFVMMYPSNRIFPNETKLFSLTNRTLRWNSLQSRCGYCINHFVNCLFIYPLSPKLAREAISLLSPKRCKVKTQLAMFFLCCF